MANTTKNRMQADWDQAKQEGKQRASRVREILQAAASETFSEVKAEAADIHVLTRKSLGVWLEELKEPSEAADTHNHESTVEAKSDRSATASETQESSVPTWRELFFQSLGIVRDRKGDWTQALIQYWKEQIAKFDADMTQKDSDRYRKVKSVLQRLTAWLESTRTHGNPSTPAQPAHPVTVEVLEEDEDVRTGIGTEKGT